MRNKLIILMFFSLFLSFSCTDKKIFRPSPLAIKGVLDLSDWSFEKNGMLNLDGEWEFFREVLLYTNKTDSTNLEAIQIKVPNIWNAYISNIKTENKAFGYGSYRLRIKLPIDRDDLAIHIPDTGTSYNLWINGEKIRQNGLVGTSVETSKPQFLPGFSRLKNLPKEMELVVEVANFTHYKGGLWETVRLGNYQEVHDYRQNRLFTDLFLLGSITIIGLYHFGLYSLRKKDFSSLFFGFFCICIAFRLMVTGERFLHYEFPSMPWELGNKIEYLSIYLAVPVFFVFARSLYPKDINKTIIYISILFHGIISILTLITPAKIYAHSLIPFEVFFLINSIYIISAFLLAIYRKREGALISFIGIFTLIGTGMNDILYSQNLLQTRYYLPFGLFVFIFIQSYLLSIKFSRAFSDVEELSENLKQTNLAYSRFVPIEFLNQLGKRSILDVYLGVQVQKEMTILFSDIRSFTKLSEHLSPRDNFGFINSYLKKMSPAIRKNRGFIDKYIGDAIMALFPENVEDALDSALAMLVALKELNYVRKEKNFPEIRIGIGIHTGTLMLGTIGDDERMDGTVISDAVNLASRMEGLTKFYSSTILVSELSFKKIKRPDKYHYRRIGRVKVKGKESTVSIYEILDSSDLTKVVKLEKTRAFYEEGLEEYLKRNFGKSLELFEKVLENFPEDKASQLYKKKSQLYLKTPPPSNWDGAEEADD
ncbi:MAG: adenylate/guanylate cyclase domain-containing protein [Leptospiraceae bacterium]|nr:adenylate/guanylate cyclase domain-containing protein [Leptospiraceae bacterium]